MSSLLPSMPRVETPRASPKSALTSSPGSSSSLSSFTPQSTPSSPPPSVLRDVSAAHVILQSLVSRLEQCSFSPACPPADNLFLHELRVAVHSASAPLCALHAGHPQRLPLPLPSASLSFSTATTPTSNRSTSSSASSVRTTPSAHDTPLSLRTPFAAAVHPLNSSTQSDDSSDHVPSRLRFSLTSDISGAQWEREEAEEVGHSSTATPLALADTSVSSSAESADSSAFLTPDQPIAHPVPRVPLARLFHKILRTPTRLPVPSFDDADDSDAATLSAVNVRPVRSPSKEAPPAPIKAAVDASRVFSPLAQPLFGSDSSVEHDEYTARTPPSSPSASSSFSTPPHVLETAARTMLKLEDVKHAIREKEKQPRKLLQQDDPDLQRGTLRWEERLRNEPAAERFTPSASSDLLYDVDDDDVEDVKKDSAPAQSPTLGTRRRRDDDADENAQGPSQRRVSPAHRPTASNSQSPSPPSLAAEDSAMELAFPALDAIVAARLAAPPSSLSYVRAPVGGLSAPRGLPSSGGVFAPSVFSAPFVPLASHMASELPLPSPFAFHASPSPSPSRTGSTSSPGSGQLAFLYEHLRLSPEGREAVAALLRKDATPVSGKHLYRAHWEDKPAGRVD